MPAESSLAAPGRRRPASKILFINKTSTSKRLSQSDGTERSQIFSHVQRSFFNGTDGQQSNTLTLRLSKASSEEAGTPNVSCIETKGGKTKRPKKCRTRKVKPNPMPEIAIMGPDALKASPMNEVSTHELDPFRSLCLPVNPYMASLLQFYRSDLSLRVFPIKSIAVISQQYTLSLALQDPVLLSALLCTTSAALYSLDFDAKHGIAAMYFKGQALQRLHAKLAEPNVEVVENSSIFAVALLLWIECVQGNLGDLRAHLSGLEQLVSRASDITTSPLPISGTIFSSSYLCSALLQIKPTLEPTVLCENEISEPTWHAWTTWITSGKTLTAHRFLTPPNRALIRPNLTEIVKQQREIMLLQELCTSQHLDHTREDYTYVYTKKVWIEFQLLSYPHVQSEEEEPVTPAQEAVCLALYTFSQPIVFVTRASAAFPQAMARQLITTVKKADFSNLWGPCLELRLWVLFITAFLSQGEVHWIWLVAQISDLIDHLHIHTVEDMEEILMGFYYFPEYFGAALKNMWKDVSEVNIKEPSFDVSPQSLGQLPYR